MNPFAKRSSLASGILTGIIGWIGFVFLAPLIFGFRVPAVELLLLATASALVQVVILRLAFFPLRMDRHVLLGAAWGGVTVIILYFGTALLYPELNAHRLYWILTYLYIGPPVGAFLSYFYIDDQKIIREAKRKNEKVAYGRDAHWLEPFGYGVFAYLVAFIPFNSMELFINVAIVGAVSGVFAAGASHFSPDKWKRSLAIAVIVLAAGSAQGFLTGFLFRNYENVLYADKAVHGIIAGVLTYLITFARGRVLSTREINKTL
jgi:hypothetical protein